MEHLNRFSDSGRVLKLNTLLSVVDVFEVVVLVTAVVAVVVVVVVGGGRFFEDFFFSSLRTLTSGLT